MTDLVRYTLDSGIATLQLDDGKRNALSPAMLKAINAALDRAAADRAVVILTGREDTLSAGFDLKVLRSGSADTLRMLGAGYALAARLMGHPFPVVAACNGHVLAMGVFMMLSCDYAIGTRGDFKISANEVALGLTMPRAAAATLRHRLTPAGFQTAVTLARYFSVDEALKAGFFDELCDAGGLMARARACATEFAKLDMRAHAGSKRRIRRDVIRHIRRSIPLDLAEAVVLGLRAATRKKA